MMNLGKLLELSALRYSRRPAVIFGSKKIIYSHLNIFTDRLARGLQELGVSHGDRVAILLDNSPYFVICYFAIVKLGAIVVPINHMFKSDEVGYILEDSQPRVLITSAGYLTMVRYLQARIPTLETILAISREHEGIRSIHEWIHDSSKVFHTAEVNEHDIAAILYTSGTTGRPKGAMLSHGNLIANVESCRDAIQATAKDRAICLLPLFHSFAATVCMLLPLAVGGALVIMKSPRPFRRTLRALRKYRVTVFVGVPSLYSILNEIKLPWWLTPSVIRLLLPVRLCISGAAALPVPVCEGFQRRFCVPLLEGYGLTEAAPVVSLNPYRGINRVGSIGRPIKGVEVAIVNEASKTLGTGQVGEIIVRGPNVMAGYYNNLQATRETIKDGWLYTGDLGKKDSHDYLYIVGRKKDMVNVRGLNVYPREIEDLLYQHPGIQEAAVIGVPDFHKGEVPKGFVVIKKGADTTERELLHYVRAHLANYKVPRSIEFRQSLPKNTAGKILKRVLVEEEHSKLKPQH